MFKLVQTSHMAHGMAMSLRRLCCYHVGCISVKCTLNELKFIFVQALMGPIGCF